MDGDREREHLPTAATADERGGAVGRPAIPHHRIKQRAFKAPFHFCSNISLFNFSFSASKESLSSAWSSFISPCASQF